MSPGKQSPPRSPAAARSGQQAITDFARYSLAWHPQAQQNPLRAQGRTSATQGPPHTLAQLVAELGPVAVPGHEVEAMGRDSVLRQQ